MCWDSHVETMGLQLEYKVKLQSDSIFYLIGRLMEKEEEGKDMLPYIDNNPPNWKSSI